MSSGSSLCCATTRFLARGVGWVSFMTTIILIGRLAPLVLDAEGILELHIPHFLGLIEEGMH